MSKVQIPVKLDAKTITRIDRHVAQFAPFCESRSALVRVLLEHAIAAIDAGTLRFDLEEIQRVLAHSRAPRPHVVQQENGQGRKMP